MSYSADEVQESREGQNFKSLALYLGVVELALPGLVEALVLVAAVAEGKHGADVEVVLAHAHPGLARLRHRLVQHALVHLPASFRI